MSDFWSIYIIALTVITVVGSFWLLFGNRTRSSDDVGRTGHSFDGIEEYENPLPAWWLQLFVITLVFAIGYLVAFPGLGSFKGVLGWSQVDQWQQDVDAAKARYEPVFAQFRDVPVEKLVGEAQAQRMGQRLFATNCSTCHGSDARGNRGFPNLTDNDWIWGGTPEAIKMTITNGRMGMMPPWAQVLGDAGVENVAHYVLTLSGTEAPGAASAAGEAQFKAICSACHGVDGKGNQLLGAPNLTDTTWLYGSELETIKHGLRNGRNGQMPAFGEQLDADRIHLLTAYVYGLSQR